MKLYLSFNNDLNSKDERMKAHELLLKTFKIKDSDIMKTKRGKPYLIDNSFYFSLSHSKGNIAFIKSKNEIGLDIEKIREVKDIELLKKKIMNDNDIKHYNKIGSKELLITWTIKESYLKFLGIGLVLDPINILIDYENNSVSYKDHEKVNYINNTLNDIIYTVTNSKEEIEYEIL